MYRRRNERHHPYRGARVAPPRATTTQKGGEMKKTVLYGLGLAVAFAAGLATNGVLPGETVAQAQAKGRVYELRTYTAVEGRLPALHSRFRDHLLGFFKKHGMTNVAYFKPTDAPASGNTIIFLLSYPSRDASKASWAAFGQDPEWKKVVAESEANGKLIMKGETVALEPTDYSPLK